MELFNFFSFQLFMKFEVQSDCSDQLLTTLLSVLQLEVENKNIEQALCNQPLRERDINHLFYNFVFNPFERRETIY